MSQMSTLNQHLFDQLERLNNPDLTPEQIEQEANRAKAIVGLADQVTANSRTMLDAAKLFAQHGSQVLPMLPQLGKPDPKTGTQTKDTPK